MLLIVTFFVFFCSPIYCGVINKNDYKFYKDMDQRIVGGEPAEFLGVAWQAALLFKSGSSHPFACGGTVIGIKHILTSASCINGTMEGAWRVRVGSRFAEASGQQYGVGQLIIHEKYGQTTNPFDYDIGLVVIFSGVDLNDPVRPVRIIALPQQDQPIEDGTVGVVTGWGSTTEGGELMDVLYKADIPVVNQKLCSDSYGNGLVTDRMLCLGDFENGGVDACTGDGGGPFAVDGHVLGVTSWGNGCGRPRYPGVFTRVASFKDWIESNVEETV